VTVPKHHVWGGAKRGEGGKTGWLSNTANVKKKGGWQESVGKSQTARKNRVGSGGNAKSWFVKTKKPGETTLGRGKRDHGPKKE